jgi:TolB-like protein/tetratricopeptide (TPR) repeat protein/predicted Ser/Thr protein kinase
MIGKAVSHYKVTEKLGAGGMGEVYLAEDTRLDRTVALKFLPSSMWNEAEAQQRLIREAKAASKLDHPNIVTIYGIDEHDGRPFIVMAHVRGLALDQYCASQQRTADELIDVFIQIADGLQHAHNAGIIHRDLKPGNILIDERGRPRILDFGIARMRGTTRLTQAGSTLGTLAYSPPELAQGKDAEAASDIFSLGVVMYQMLTGRLPFEGEHESALVYSIVHEPPIPFRESGASVPFKLQSLVLRCLEKLPHKRFPNCAGLINELHACKSGAISGATAGTAEAKPSIAVLPFANMSADPENEYFADGLSEELMNVLARNPGLKVTGRTSSFAFKGKQEDLRDIGQKLGVETLLEGSVRKSGNRVRITAQLVKASDGFHLWTDTYDRVLDDIFVVQDDIAKSVSEAMKVALLGSAAQKSKGNPETFALIVQAHHFMSQLTRDSLATAKTLFDRAIEIDSNDARAWAGLGRCLMAQAGYGYSTDEFASRTAREACERALQLDDALPEANWAMGMICLFGDLDWERAGHFQQRAYDLAPSDGRIIMGLVNYETFRGDFSRGPRLALEAVRLDPLNATTHMFAGRTFWFSGDLIKAMELFRKAAQLSPGIASAQTNLAAVLVTAGRFEEALLEAHKEAPSGYRDTAHAVVYWCLGRSADSDRALSELLSKGEQWGFQIAIAYAVRGDNDKAFQWLERALELHDSGLPSTRSVPLLRNLHDDPRWPLFLKKIGLDT